MPLRQFRMYLDECGTEDYGCVDEPGGRYLSLVGVIIDRALVQDATDKLEAVRQRFFERDPDEPPVCFHRTDIQRFRGPFESLRDAEKRAEFGRWWLRYLEVVDYTVISVVIDKKAMQKKENWKIRHPYHYGMPVLVEKFAQFLDRNDANGDVMPEARGGRKDVALQAAYDEVWTGGTYFVGRGLIQKRLPARKLKFRGKRDTITGLQICDSIAKPAQDFVLLKRRDISEVSEFSAAIQEILERSKFDRGRTAARPLWGYGIKFLP